MDFTPLDQKTLDNQKYQELLYTNNRKKMKEFRDRLEPPLDEEIKSKANAAIIALEKAYILAQFNGRQLEAIEKYPGKDKDDPEGGPPLSAEAEQYKKEKIAELKKILEETPKIPDPFDPNNAPTQKDIDLAELNRLVLANDLPGLKKLRDRVTPPLDPEVKEKVLAAIKAIEDAGDAAGAPPDWEIGKPGGVFKPEYKFPAITSQNILGPTFIQTYTGGSTAGIVRPRITKLPPQEEVIIGQSVVLPKEKQPEKGLLTEEGFRQLKALGMNILKYTGMYVAPAVLAGVAYQFSKNQPDGTLLRSIADIIPAPKYNPQQAAEFQSTMGKIGNIFTEVIPDIVKGTTPGKPGGRIIEDIPGTLTGPSTGPFETPSLDVLKNLERVAGWGLKEREQINDIFPKAPSVLSMEIDNFPTVEYRNSDVARYATQNNGSVSSDLLTFALQNLSKRMMPKPTKVMPFTKVSSLVMGMAQPDPREMQIDRLTEVVIDNFVFPKRGSDSPQGPRKKFAFGSKDVGGKRSRLG